MGKKLNLGGGDLLTWALLLGVGGVAVWKGVEEFKELQEAKNPAPAPTAPAPSGGAPATAPAVPVLTAGGAVIPPTTGTTVGTAATGNVPLGIVAGDVPRAQYVPPMTTPVPKEQMYQGPVPAVLLPVGLANLIRPWAALPIPPSPAVAVRYDPVFEQTAAKLQNFTAAKLEQQVMPRQNAWDAL
ncbi:hypothetical protein ACFFLM_21290 [Deinococcus oregonensis]|uniref:Uncharacterized protein n=1 Tax=Deinococcus oregonensis TaxID=1805970 RepID=A0ABV6B473_9DEIO